MYRSHWVQNRFCSAGSNKAPPDALRLVVPLVPVGRGMDGAPVRFALQPIAFDQERRHAARLGCVRPVSIESGIVTGLVGERHGTIEAIPRRPLSARAGILCHPRFCSCEPQTRSNHHQVRDGAEEASDHSDQQPAPTRHGPPRYHRHSISQRKTLKRSQGISSRRNRPVPSRKDITRQLSSGKSPGGGVCQCSSSNEVPGGSPVIHS